MFSPIKQPLVLIAIFSIATISTIFGTEVYNGAQWVDALKDPAAMIINIQADFSIKNSQITRDGVTINGNNHIISYAAGGAQSNEWIGDMFSVICNNLTVSDLTFRDKLRDNGYGGGGIIFNPKQADPLIPANNLTFNNVKVINCEIAGVYCSYFGVTGEGPIVTNLTFNNCEASSNGLSGIQLSRAEQVTFDGGAFFRNNQSGIYFERGVSDASVNDVDIYENGLPSVTNNTNPNAGAGLRVYDGGGWIGYRLPSTDITVSNSRIKNNNIHGIELSLNSDRINIISNEIYQNGKNGNGAQGAGVAFQIGESDDCTIAGNTIADNADPAIYMYRSDYLREKVTDHSGNILYGNTLDNNGGGIVVLGSQSFYIVKNTIRNTVNSMNGVSGGEGNSIYLGAGSHAGVIWENTIESAPNGYGILISDRVVWGENTSTNDVYILENKIIDAQAGGIRVENSNTTQIGNATGIIPLARIIENYGTITINPSGILKNIINGSGIHSIDLFNTSGTEINGAIIGTLDGINPGNHSGNGINLQDCSNIKIGVEKANIISGSINGYGVFADSCKNITIQQNFIGSTVSGDAALPNGQGGIYFSKSLESKIGGPGKGNLISGNDGNAIHIDSNSKNIEVEANNIGTSSDQSTDIANSENGVFISNSNKITLDKNNVRSSLASGINLLNTDSITISDNVISHNALYGINSESSDHLILTRNNLFCNEIHPTNDFSTSPTVQSVYFSGDSLKIIFLDSQNGKRFELFNENSECVLNSSVYHTNKTVSGKNVSFFIPENERTSFYTYTLTGIESSTYTPLEIGVITAQESNEKYLYKILNKANEFKITVNNSEKFSVKIYDSIGNTVTTSNEEICYLELGKNWTQGLYIAHIHVNGKLFIEKLLKR